MTDGFVFACTECHRAYAFTSYTPMQVAEEKLGDGCPDCGGDVRRIGQIR